jgi:hypothetical protein
MDLLLPTLRPLPAAGPSILDLLAAADAVLRRRGWAPAGASDARGPCGLTDALAEAAFPDPDSDDADLEDAAAGRFSAAWTVLAAVTRALVGRAPGHLAGVTFAEALELLRLAAVRVLIDSDPAVIGDLVRHRRWPLAAAPTTDDPATTGPDPAPSRLPSPLVCQRPTRKVVRP